MTRAVVRRMFRLHVVPFLDSFPLTMLRDVRETFLAELEAYMLEREMTDGKA